MFVFVSHLVSRDGVTRGLVCETDTCIRKVYYTLVRHVLQVQTLKDKPEKETDTRLDSRVTRTPLIEHCKQERDEQAIPGEEAAITLKRRKTIPRNPYSAGKSHR